MSEQELMDWIRNHPNTDTRAIAEAFPRENPRTVSNTLRALRAQGLVQANRVEDTDGNTVNQYRTSTS